MVADVTTARLYACAQCVEVFEAASEKMLRIKVVTRSWYPSFFWRTGTFCLSVLIEEEKMSYEKERN